MIRPIFWFSPPLAAVTFVPDFTLQKSVNPPADRLAIFRCALLPLAAGCGLLRYARSP